MLDAQCYLTFSIYWQNFLSITVYLSYKLIYLQLMVISKYDIIYDWLQVNCVVMRGINDDEICDFVKLTKDKPINVRFIEFMPFDGNVWNVKKLVPYAEIFNKVVR